MNNKKQLLPIGIQDFAKLREKQFIYVDKTEIIYNLLNDSGNVYFLSRPRRFGKSLFLSTLFYVFRGRKDLFEGLYIYDKWDWSRQHPVIIIDFGTLSYSTPEILTRSLKAFLDAKATYFGFTLNKTDLADKFYELIEKLHEKTSKKVVLLIDEYDKAIIDNMTKLDIADSLRETLKNFYQVIKGADTHLEFVFFTGVSKFAKMSIFSGLNNLTDITLIERYSTICGYTQEELEKNFDYYIEKIALDNEASKDLVLKKIKEWYDGYTWDGKTQIYNPFTTLLFLNRGEFLNYWYETGSPTFLIELIKRDNDIRPILNSITVEVEAFSSFELDNPNIEALFMQTGYLTIKKIIENEFGESPDYVLDIPNREVRDTLTKDLLMSFVNNQHTSMYSLSKAMKKQIQKLDSEGFEKSLKTLFANIPYNLHINKESYYHSMFLLTLKCLGFRIGGEILTDIGRIDAVMELGDKIIISEIKYSIEKSVEKLIKEALEQIREKKYYEKYLDNKKEIIILGLGFSGANEENRVEVGAVFEKV